MKRIVLLLLLLPVGFTSFGQSAGKKKSKHNYYILIEDSSFVASMPERGASLKAYFEHDTITKIETVFRFNFGDVRREYYYWDDTISLINETQRLYNATAVPAINPDTIKANYSGRYIFKNRKLTDISQKGSYSISDTPSTREEQEAAFLMLSDKYQKLAYERRKNKKSRRRE